MVEYNLLMNYLLTVRIGSGRVDWKGRIRMGWMSIGRDNNRKGWTFDSDVVDGRDVVVE